jgi:hypothetical protein
MPNYTFRISRGRRSERSVAADCPDDGAARREAGGMFVDVARDVAGNFEENPAWQIEVDDQSGKLIFRLSLLAESME